MTYLLGLAPGLSNVTFTGLPGAATASYNPASGAVTFTGMPATLASGATITIGVGYTAPSSGSVMVMTSIGTSTSEGPNTQPDSASGTTAISPLADVTTSISMPPSAVAGSAVSGTVTYTNTGPSTADGTTFILGLPPGLTNVTFTGLPGAATATYDSSSGAVTFTGMPASLGAGSSISVGVAFTAPASGSVIIASEIGTTTSQGPNTLADTATSTTAVSPLADVTTTISLPVSAIAGSTVNGTVTYRNNGPSAATAMTYSLGLPPGLASVTISSLPPGAMASYNPASGAVTFSGMPPILGAGSSLTINIAYTAPTSGSVTTTSSISTATSEGTNTLPDNASVTTAISPLADVTTSISIPANAVASSTVNGSVVYTNNGPSSAAGISYTLGLAPGLSGVCFSGVPGGATASY